MEKDKIKLDVEYIDIDKLIPYSNNAKMHPEEQVEQIKKSITEFGMNDPIAIDKNNVIIEGHGRLIACKELGYDKVPIIRLDHLTDEERKAYTLAHNKLTMNSDFNMDILEKELKAIDTINMEDFGFDYDFGLDEEIIEEEKNPYTTTINIPQYEIKGEEPKINELYNSEKTNVLIDEIVKANITDEQKEFLIKAAQRHLGFNYSKIAEYYAHQDKEMQELMEKSALVIIDFEDAIRNGYAEYIKGTDDLIENEE